ncbi:LOW QUALITY PROTEIN: hypothetical protein V2J09_006953 [Rumex salicifolius]
MADRGKKRRRSNEPQKLLINDKVEVRSIEDGLLGSWHPANIVARKTKQYLVMFNNLVCDDDKSKQLSEYVDVSPSLGASSDYRGRIRPTPPKVDLHKPLLYSECVDVYYNDAWWEGVVFDPKETSGKWKIFFPDLADELPISTDNLRLTQDWNECTGEWSLRGHWVFLEIIQKLQMKFVLPVSIQQIWYDVRSNPNYQRDMEWTFQKRVVWEELILEVINEYLQIISREVLNRMNLTQDLVEYDEPIEALDCPVKSGDLVAASMATEGGLELLESSDISHEEGESIVPVLTSIHGVHEQPNALSLSPSVQAKDVGETPCSSRVSHKWQPIVPLLVPGAEEFPASPAEYMKSTKKQRKKLTMNLRQHLLFLGWKIDFYTSLQAKNTVRYISPDGNPYFSLVKVCEVLKGNPSAKSSSDLKEIKENDSTSLTFHCVHSPAFKTDESVKSRYCPEALSEYLQKPKVSNLAKQARQHLSAIGWTFLYVYGKLQRRYESPEGNTYYSLKMACMHASVSNTVPSPSQLKERSTDLLTILSDAKKSMVPLLQQSEECNQKNHSMLNDEGGNFANELIDAGERSLVRKPSPSIKSRKRKMISSSVNQSARALRSSNRTREVVAFSTVPHHPRTVLSLLISNNIVLPRKKVYYRGKDNQTMAEGRITIDGIKCACCQKIFSLSGFESHAKSKSLNQQPAANIFLEDGRSLVKCQLQMLHNSRRSFQKETLDGGEIQSVNDHICSVCRDGGELLLCDRCPSSFHASCLGLQTIPDGDWYCPSCCCGICGTSQSVDSKCQMNEKSTLCCDQCELHISCLGGRGGVNLGDYTKAKWFCCRLCSQIYKGLQKLQRKPIPLDHDNLTWTLIKPMQYESGDDLDEGYVSIMAENHSKLSLALEVIKECFEPVKEPLTGRDLVEDVVFGRGSELKRLNFKGFYIILLEKNDELITVATLRIYGGKVAEVPLVATRFHYRRLGMCRLLMSELEKNLMELGVEKLVLPAAPTTLNTWTSSFGFREVRPLERSELLAYTFLDFQGTVMCQKLLGEPALPTSTISKDSLYEVQEVVDKCEESTELDCKSAISVEFCESVHQGPLDIPEDNDNIGCKDPHTDAMVIHEKMNTNNSTIKQEAHFNN